MEYVFGIVLASMTMSFANLVRDSNRELFYAAVLIIVGLTNIGFAYYFETPAIQYRDILTALSFFVIAVTGYCKGLWVIIFGLIAHGLYTVFQFEIVPDAHLPAWWPPFCYAYDITLAFWLSSVASRRTTSQLDLHGAPR